jgi:adenylylsulfate kinase
MGAFAVWLTGLPASGKSAIARALLAGLQARGAAPAVLESDVMRTQLTPRARYDDAERDLFYEVLADLGMLLVEREVPVIFDATANRRAYRDRARARIARFAEVFVDCPPEICRARDPKGLYRRAARGGASALPGAQAVYEAPEHPELVVRSETETPQQAASRILALLEQRRWLGNLLRSVP